jgi:WD40 repeat protein
MWWLHVHVLLSCRYRGHVSVKTIKDVAFVGSDQSMVAAGSDEGRFFIWDRYTGEAQWPLIWDRYTDEAQHRVYLGQIYGRGAAAPAQHRAVA